MTDFPKSGWWGFINTIYINTGRDILYTGGDIIYWWRYINTGWDILYSYWLGYIYWCEYNIQILVGI